MGYLIGGVILLILAAIILCAGIVATIPAAPIWGLALLLLPVAAVTVAVGLGLHKSIWPTGGARAIALLAVAVVLGTWGTMFLTTALQWWLRIHGLGWLATTLGFVMAIIVLIAGFGMVFRGTGAQGSPAFLIGFTLLGGVGAVTDLAAIYSFGESSLRYSVYSGEDLWEGCSFSRGGYVVTYPKWKGQKTCPFGAAVATGSKTTASNTAAGAAVLDNWEGAGLAPGMSRREIVGRYLCLARKSEAEEMVGGLEGSLAKKLEILLAAEEEFRCDAVGDTTAWIQKEGGWSALFSFKNVLILAFIAGVGIMIVEWLLSLGKGSGTPSKPHGH